MKDPTLLLNRLEALENEFLDLIEIVCPERYAEVLARYEANLPKLAKLQEDIDAFIAYRANLLDKSGS